MCCKRIINLFLLQNLMYRHNSAKQYYATCALTEKRQSAFEMGPSSTNLALHQLEWLTTTTTLKCCKNAGNVKETIIPIQVWLCRACQSLQNVQHQRPRTG